MEQKHPSMTNSLKSVRYEAERQWALRKYDIMARGYQFYKEVSQCFREASTITNYAMIIERLNEISNEEPYSAAGLRTSIEHMWGYINKKATSAERQHMKMLWQQWQEELIRHPASTRWSITELPSSAAALLDYIKTLSDVYQITYLQNSFKASFCALN